MTMHYNQLFKTSSFRRCF